MELYRRRTYGEWCALKKISLLAVFDTTDKDCYSYRRESDKTGRMALFGMLQERWYIHT